ncbi:MAG: WD40 repeat domain-containing protein [Parcubacteria group bacterium]
MKRIQHIRTRAAVITAIVIFVLPSTAGAWTYTPASTEDVVGDPQVSADGKSIVLISDVKKKTYDQVLFFTNASEKPKWTFSPDAKVFEVGLSDDGKYVAAVGSKVWLLKSSSKKPVWSAKIPMSVFDAVALSKTGGVILAGDRQSQVQMFKSSSSSVQKVWKFKPDDGVFDLSLSNDGKRAIAVTKKTVHFIKTDVAAEVWSYKTKEQLMTTRISADGKYAVAATTKTLYFFNTSKKTPVWSKIYKTGTDVQIDISDDGSRVVALANKSVRAYNASGKELWQYDMKNSNWGDITLSGNGKYVAVGQGEDYVYVLDNAYGTGNRPFRIFTSERPPRYVAFSQIGNLLAYGRYTLTTYTPAAGVLADQKSTPIYQNGDFINLRVFATNPSAKAKNLRLRIALSLPQINWWDQVASAEESQAQTPIARSKTLEYVADKLPGYSEVYNKPLTLEKNSSVDTTLNIEVASLLMPEWLEDFISFLGDLNPLSTLLGDWEEPYQKLIGKEEANTTLGAVNEKAMEENLMYPMLGLGTVSIYDPDTNMVYDTDSFYFMYIL